ncbi:hypothetical protein [Petropleomorpha daqingensis]|uniref:Uncharacterized protein n=1 Tax=Petropleomorpha daqingensis TaxID=2026353 RepID=A0A853CF78_9ACTN|nr:hypothetical protein [Petropleomorpha daqingensis]NYJ06544.1 hypothetical protein [Petropleomorpha daqingensis]
MTTTMIRSETTTSTTDLLRDVLHATLDRVAGEDPDSFDSRTPGGRELLSLAARARQAAGSLGADAGTTVASGPGIVVVREFAAAVRLLDQAA